MKNIIKYFLILLVFANFLYAYEDVNTSPVSQEFVSGVPQEFFSGRKVELKKHFLNTIFAVGNSINFTGNSNEDILLFGFNVKINGTMKKSVYILADQVYISGTIKGNLNVIAKEIHINRCTVIGSTSLISPSVNIGQNTYFKNITKIYANHAIIGGYYKTLLIKGKKINFLSNMHIKDNLYVQSAEKPYIPLSSVIRGKYHYKKFFLPKIENILSTKNRMIFSFLSLCVPFILMVFFMPNFLRDTVAIIDTSPVKVFFTGVFGIILTPIILFILMLTLIGAPLSFILLFFYFALIYFSRGFAAAGLGRQIFIKLRETHFKTLLSVIIGIGIFVFLTSIPVAGYFFQGLFIIFGFGAMTSGRIMLYKKLRKSKIL
ncbi:MAG: hypothetical protein M1135_02405 [Candidatus Omnitrophica bacterium]|nr:hypothetical protein [Candidatus Omnitrophota bacterium]